MLSLQHLKPLTNDYFRTVGGHKQSMHCINMHIPATDLLMYILFNNYKS